MKSADSILNHANDQLISMKVLYLHASAMALSTGILAKVIVFFIIAPDSILAGRTMLSEKLHEESVTVSHILASDPSRLVSRATGLNIDPGFLAHTLPNRRMLMETTKLSTKVEGKVTSMMVPSSSKTQSAHFVSKFAFMFTSLAKGSTSPSTGTPSPGHN